MNRGERQFSTTFMEKYESKLYNDIILDNSSNAHCILELSTPMFTRMCDNTITLRGLSCENGVQYNTIEYGRNIRCNAKRRLGLSNNCSDVIDLTRVKHNYIIIVALCEECLRVFPNIHIINSGCIYEHLNKSCNSSGYVLLSIATSKNPQGNKNRKKWNKEDFILLKRCKNNIIKKNNNHHNSIGHYFSFGNKAKFEVKDDSSIGLYSTRKPHASYSQGYLDELAKKYETLCAAELLYAKESFCKLIPMNNLFIMPILNATHKGLIDMNIESPLQKTKANESGCWASSICVNAETQILHTENDCTYTIICAPRQMEITSKYEFNFCFNSTNNLSIVMNSGVSFMFSGLLLQHKQYKLNPNNDEIFYNFSAYGNQRLLRHLKQTLFRLFKK